MAFSVTDSEALLKLKQSFRNSEALDSWKPGTNACEKDNKWAGVICVNGNVNSIQLNGMNLSGIIDVDALLQIPGLRILGFMFNSFSGPIPGFNRLGALRAIYLTGNEFSGEISEDYFGKMESLKKVWLSNNKFVGSIPLSLGRLPHLFELHLEGNQFSGTIPPLEQPTLMSLDLSNNNLRGEIPQGLSRFNASSFQGNPGICGEKLGISCGDTMEPSSNGDDDNSRMISIGFLIASGIMLLLMCFGIYVLMRRQERECNIMVKENLDESIGLPIASTSKKELSGSRKRFGSSRKGSNRIGDIVIVNDEKGEFGLSDLMKASAEVLGSGTLGSTYKALMSNGLAVVVKRIKEMNKIGKDGFDAEIRRFGRLKHKNVLTPLAYHFRKDEKLLVYEYIPKGSLLYQLHADRGPSHAELNWPTRLKIIEGIAQGLGYLHTELSTFEVPHGNLRSNNVLLNLDNEPILADYGYSCLISGQARQSLFAYKSPEVVQHQQKATPKCDVYSFGVIILELITGKFPSQYLNSGTGGTDVVQWAKSAIAEGRETEIYDPEIASSRNSLGEMELLLHIAADCTENDPEQRLDIREAIRRIEDIQIGGYQRPASFHVLPSLRDGYAESADSTQSQLGLNAEHVYDDQQRNSISIDQDNRSGLQPTESFAFDPSHPNL
ncbi:hypothetical protein ACH5RR_007890 [Cinchona calisaya]|uniref:Protein kinase domain-containing protein n=1 Tax=Cinchona calisaya TaxID=153742 RepID=A0ABD3AAJ9_9GENT